MQYRLGDQNQVLRDDKPGYAGGLLVHRNTNHDSYFLGCCGMAGLSKFDYAPQSFVNWNDKAEYIALLYRTLYDKGNVIYTLTESQFDNPVHQALLEIGAREVFAFPNLYHAPNIMHMFHVNIRKAAGVFCNKYGEAYANQTAVSAEDVLENVDQPPRPNLYASLPRR